jgi:hypothetical protein
LRQFVADLRDSVVMATKYVMNTQSGATTAAA